MSLGLILGGKKSFSLFSQYFRGKSSTSFHSLNIPVQSKKNCSTTTEEVRKSRNHKLPVLTFYTKDCCQLCDEAIEKISEAGLLDRVKLEPVDITLPENDRYFGLYRYEIPVFFFDKKFLCKNFIDIQLLKEKIEKFNHHG